MTEQTTVSLEEVRERFLEAETRLGEAAKAIQAIDDAATRVGAARESLSAAGDEIRALAGQFADVASSLSENAEELRRGVDAIRLGDPAAVRRQIEELDAAFTALQSVMADRFGALEASQSALGVGIESTAAAHEAGTKSARLEARIIGAVTILLVVGTIVLLLIR